MVKRKKKKRGIVSAVVLLCLLSFSVQAEEINTDSTVIETEGVDDELLFSNGGALVTEEGEFYEQKKDNPVDIVEDATNTSSNVEMKVDPKKVIVSSWVGKGLDNTYRWTSDGTIVSESGKKYKQDFWLNILINKERYVAERMEQIKKENFADLTFRGDLDVADGSTSFWAEDPNAILARSGHAVTFRIHDGSQNYYFIMDSGNQQAIVHTLKAIDQFKDAVRHGLLRGSISLSYNVYSFYSSVPVYLSSVIEKGKDGTYGLKGGSNVNYSAQYFLNPLFGKMRYSDVLEKGTQATYEKWQHYMGDIKIIYASGDKLIFGLNSQYYNFLSKDTEEAKFLTGVENLPINKGDGLKGYTSKYSSKTVATPSDLADTSLNILSLNNMSKITDSTGSDTRVKLGDEGATVTTSYKYLIKTDGIYSLQNNSYKLENKLDDIGLSTDTVLLYKAKKDGVTVGGIMPAEYKEVIYNPSDTKEYYTGRTLKFGGDFYNSIGLTEQNTQKLSIKANNQADYGEKIQAYGFPQGKSYKDKESHAKMDSNTTVVDFETSFRLPAGDKVAGAIMYRNNTYAEDEELLRWLDTPEAKAMTSTGVDAELLKELIKGIFNTEEQPLTFEEHMRLQEIKEEMAGSFESNTIKLIVTVSAYVGYALCFYAIVIVLMYLLDLVNPITDRSILRMITLGRLHSVAHSEDVEAYRSSHEGSAVAYVAWYHVLFIGFCIMFVGIIFILSNPLIELIIKMWDMGGKVLG